MTFNAEECDAPRARIICSENCDLPSDGNQKRGRHRRGISLHKARSLRVKGLQESSVLLTPAQAVKTRNTNHFSQMSHHPIQESKYTSSTSAQGTIINLYVCNFCYDMLQRSVFQCLLEYGVGKDCGDKPYHELPVLSSQSCAPGYSCCKMIPGAPSSKLKSSSRAITQPSGERNSSI